MINYHNKTFEPIKISKNADVSEIRYLHISKKIQ